MSSKKQKKEKASTCAICGAKIYWGNKTKDYGKPTSSGRSHGSLHHYVPERFFGRSANRKMILEMAFSQIHHGKRIFLIEQ